MTRFRQFIERHPLALSILALITSLPSLAGLCLPSYTGPTLRLAFDWGAVGICCVSLSIALLALVSLIRAEKRGYSSTKVGLAVAALFFAFVPDILFALKLLALGRS